MNFQSEPTKTPLKVIVVNSLAPAAQLLETKILSGFIFGETQLIDLILLVYTNEKEEAEGLLFELEKCAFRCMNTIRVSTDLPKITDGDVFCIITNFSNPNFLDFDKADTDDQFDSLYLTIKLANNFIMTQPDPETENKIPKKGKEELVPKIPLIVADGLVAIDIMNSLSKDLPCDIFFCPSALPGVAKSLLANYLKVKCNEINDILVWAANDEVFHVEVEKPIIIHDKSTDDYKCSWDAIGQDLLECMKLDHSQFSPSWMKKEYIEKIYAASSKNPYGSIFKASVLGDCLRQIWKVRKENEAGIKLNTNMGVISDGSLGTIKGCPYVLPIVLSENSWIVNKRYEDSFHLKGVIKKMNKTMQAHHEKLIPYCKNFLEENVKKLSFVPADEDDDSPSYVTSTRTSDLVSSERKFSEDVDETGQNHFFI